MTSLCASRWQALGHGEARTIYHVKSAARAPANAVFERTMLPPKCNASFCPTQAVHCEFVSVQLPEKDDKAVTRKQLMAMLDVCMGGRVAEEMIFGADDTTTGATSDLNSATRIARAMRPSPFASAP